LALWRGNAYGEFAEEWWARAAAAKLDDLRLLAIEDRISALIELGEAERAATDARALAAEHAMRERPTKLLAVALAASGRQVESLRTLHAFRVDLADRTGLDPTPSFTELEHEIAAGRLPDLHPTDRTARGYVLGEVLGEGAFGTVYRSTQPGLGRDVAVKVVRVEMANDPAFIQRFEPKRNSLRASSILTSFLCTTSGANPAVHTSFSLDARGERAASLDCRWAVVLAEGVGSRRTNRIGAVGRTCVGRRPP
jgi:hypothetical protein